jgi:hypothetical protein
MGKILSGESCQRLMGRVYKTVFYIDRDPQDLDKGWGWVELPQDFVREYNIEKSHPGSRRVQRSKEITTTRVRQDEQGNNIPYSHTYTHTYDDFIRPPSRGKAAAKKYKLNIGNQLTTLGAQKSLTIKAICHWLKTWAPPETILITPGNRSISLDGELTDKGKAEFIYFVLNRDSDAIKIGRAKDIDRRLKSLQTASPAQLELIKTIQVHGSKEVQAKERELHQKFEHLHINGEWFRASAELLGFLDNL